MELFFRLNPVALTLLIPALLCAGLAIYALNIRHTPGARVFAFVNIAVAISSLAYGAELASLNLESMLLVTEFEYLGVATLPVLWLILTMIYTGHRNWVRARYIAVLFIIPVVTIILVSTCQFQHYFYSSFGLDNSGPFPQLVVGRGLWYWVNAAYTNVLIILSAVLLLEKLRHPSPAYRPQIIALLIGVAVPAISNGLYLALDLMVFGHVVIAPFAFAVSGLVIAWSIFRYRLFSVIPVARDHVMESMRDGVIVVDSENKLGDINTASMKIFGWNASDIGKPIGALLADWPEIAALYQIPDISRQEISHAGAEAQWHYEVTMSMVSDRQGRRLGRLAVIRDITERKVLEQKLEMMATHDSLTGLPGRVLLIDRVEMAIKRARRNAGQLAVIMLDLDHFKAVNDTLGHSLGNSLLKAVAARLKDSLRKNDTVARWGGDEFVILLPEIKGVEEATSACGRLLFYFQNPLAVEGHSLYVSLSLGIAIFPQDGDSFEELFEKADSAMYRAKRNGRRRYELVAPRQKSAI